MARPKLSVTPPPPEESGGQKLWRTGNNVQAQDQRWLLPGRITQNALCIVEGDPASGKSTFLAHLAAAVTTGRSWLGRPKQAPGGVLWLSGEEDFGSMIAPRLAVAGADLGRVHVPELDEHGVARQLYLPGCVRQLRDAIDDCGLLLIVLEPLVSFVPAEVSLNQEGPARSVCDPLNRLALETGCCIVVTRGLRKDRSGPRLSHGSGHGTMANTARSVLVIDRPDPEREKRVVRAIKVLGRPAPPLAYDLERAGDRPPTIVGLVELSGEADDPCAQTVSPGERSARSDAREMLKTLCAAEYVSVKTIQAAAEASGLGWRTVQEVKAELGIHSRPNRQLGTFFHEWGPPLDGWPPLSPPLRSTNCALPTKRKSRRKTKGTEAQE